MKFLPNFKTSARWMQGGIVACSFVTLVFIAAYLYALFVRDDGAGFLLGQTLYFILLPSIKLYSFIFHRFKENFIDLSVTIFLTQFIAFSLGAIIAQLFKKNNHQSSMISALIVIFGFTIIFGCIFLTQLLAPYFIVPR